MSDAYLLSGVRTPYGKYRGGLAHLDSMELATAALSGFAERCPSVSQVDGAMLAMVMQAGYGPNPSRTAVHGSGIGERIPSVTVNNACLAGVDTVVDAARRIERGEGRSYLVGGFDSSSRAPMVAFEGQEGLSALYQDSLTCHIGGESMTELSDRRNRELGIGREEQDAWAVESHRRATAATDLLREEILPVTAIDGSVLDHDEGVRPDSSVEKAALLTPVVQGGTITPANASQISDGAAVGMVGDSRTAQRHGLEPIARIAGWGYSAGPTNSLHEQPSNASAAMLDRAGLTAADIDLWEVNEAFAGVSIHAVRELGLDPEAVNVNGGAIALGHPYGGTGLRLVLTLGLELRRRGLRRGVATLCGGGGQGIALLLERG